MASLNSDGLRCKAMGYDKATGTVTMEVTCEVWRPAFWRFFVRSAALAARRCGVSPYHPVVAAKIGAALVSLNIQAARQALTR